MCNLLSDCKKHHSKLLSSGPLFRDEINVLPNLDNMREKES